MKTNKTYYNIIIRCSKFIRNILIWFKPKLFKLYQKGHVKTLFSIKIIISYIVLKLYRMLYYVVILSCFLKLYWENRKEYKHFLRKILIYLTLFISFISISYIYPVFLFIITFIYISYTIYKFWKNYNKKWTFLQNIDDIISKKMLKKQKLINQTTNKYLK